MGLRNVVLVARDMIGGAYVDGVWTQTASAPYNVRCSKQPMSPAAMLALPEGRRELRSFVLFTSRKLNDVNSQNPTRVTIEGEEYEVFSCNPWENKIINHFEVIVQRMQVVAGVP